jgi:hypothetical protein
MNALGRWKVVLTRIATLVQALRWAANFVAKPVWDALDDAER